MELRKQIEAAEARGETADAPKKTKKAAATKTKRVKEKVLPRKRLIWVVYNGSMKEEGRFAYDQRDAAEERIEALRQKSKKLYFIQPLKEVIGELAGTAKPAAAAFEEEEVKAPRKKKAAASDDDDEEEDDDDDDDDDDE
jgi:hypothetical protein